MTYAYEGDTLVNSFLVSTGTWQHPTVTGEYRVYVKYRYADMSGPGYYLADVPYVMYFYKGYGLHGTSWHSHFGTRCRTVRQLSTPDAGWLFDWASVGTIVYVHLMRALLELEALRRLRAGKLFLWETISRREFSNQARKGFWGFLLPLREKDIAHPRQTAPRRSRIGRCAR